MLLYIVLAFVLALAVCLSLLTYAAKRAAEFSHNWRSAAVTSAKITAELRH